AGRIISDYWTLDHVSLRRAARAGTRGAQENVAEGSEPGTGARGAHACDSPHAGSARDLRRERLAAHRRGRASTRPPGALPFPRQPLSLQFRPRAVGIAGERSVLERSAGENNVGESLVRRKSFGRSRFRHVTIEYRWVN